MVLTGSNSNMFDQLFTRIAFWIFTAFIALTGMGITGCELLQMKDNVDQEEDVRKVVARVYDTYLYDEDLQGILPPGISEEDSARRIKSYVKTWIKKQLLISQAATQIEFNVADIERKVLDYRYALMVYEYEKYYVNRELNLEVTEEEINDYYKKNRQNFELKQNIIKGIFLKIPKEAPNQSRVKRWVKSKKESEREELKSYCFQFANSYSLDDSTWVNFDEIIKNTPLVTIPNKTQFLRTNRYIETEDDTFLYLFNLYDYKISEEISPLDFVSDDIENIIINKRKIELANQLEEEIYNRAAENNDFEIISKN